MGWILHPRRWGRFSPVMLSLSPREGADRCLRWKWRMFFPSQVALCDRHTFTLPHPTQLFHCGTKNSELLVPPFLLHLRAGIYKELSWLINQGGRGGDFYPTDSSGGRPGFLERSRERIWSLGAQSPASEPESPGREEKEGWDPASLRGLLWGEHS